MRRYESVTGHIRCTVYRARLLAGRLDTEYSCTRSSPLEAGRTSTQSSLQARLQARLRRAGLQACHIVGPSGPTTCRAFRLDYKSGLQAGLTQASAPLSSSSTPQSPLTPMPPRRFELVGLELDLRRCYAAAEHLSELDWRLICASRTLVSSKAWPCT